MTEKQSSYKCDTTQGRKPSAPEDYNINYQEAMIEGYSDGKSDTWIRAKVFDGVAHATFTGWLENDQFLACVKRGHAFSQSYWEDISQDHANGGNSDANATSLIFNMSNRFKDDWKQRQSVEQTTTHHVELEDVKKAEQFLIDNGIDPNTL